MKTSMDLAKQEKISHEKMYDYLKSLMEKHLLSEVDYATSYFENNGVTKCYILLGELEKVYTPIKPPKPRVITNGKK